MARFGSVTFLLYVVTVIFCSRVAAESRFSGEFSDQYTVFLTKDHLPNQSPLRDQPSFLTIEAKLVTSLFKGLDFTLNPYYRYDNTDGQRTLFDMHALKLNADWKRVRVKVGYDVEFWGVMEFINPVNILNQTDVTEDFLGNRRLGQPMAVMTLVSRFGTLYLYTLKYFQPMQFRGVNGRLRPVVPIDEDQVEYGSEEGSKKVERALRYSGTFKNVFVGVSYFEGYRRDPEMLIKLDSQSIPFLVPRYNLQNQAGLELQVTFDNLILKSEGVRRWDTDWKRQSDAVGVGWEYDFGALMDQGQNISFFNEYYLDRREGSLIVPFNNDFFVGIRLGLNDKRSTDLRLWTNYNTKRNSSDVVMLDASARISDQIKVVGTYRGIVSSKAHFDSIANDSHVTFKILIYF